MTKSLVPSLKGNITFKQINSLNTRPSDSVKSNIININNQNHRIKQALIRIAELTNQIDKEYKEALLQPVSSQALSEQVAAFQPSQEGSSVIESLTEAPIRSHGFGKCGCGGLGRTAFC